MIRKLTSLEKEKNPNVSYVFERNGYKTWLNEAKFNLLAKEIITILKENKEDLKLEAKNDCELCHGTGFFTYGGSFGGSNMTRKCFCGA